MDGHRTQHNLFEVYLRLRPPPPGAVASDRILTVEEPETSEEREQREASGPSHITLNPPTDRRRAIEKFGFTRVFEEEASQLDVFHCAEVVPLVEGVLAPTGGEGTDAMVATLGVTGSGKVRNSLCLLSPLTDPDTHDPRFQEPARPYAARARRPLPLDRPEHDRRPRPCRSHRLPTSLRRLGSLPDPRLELHRRHLLRRPRRPITRCHTSNCTNTRASMYTSRIAVEPSKCAARQRGPRNPASQGALATIIDVLTSLPQPLHPVRADSQTAFKASPALYEPHRSLPCQERC